MQTNIVKIESRTNNALVTFSIPKDELNVSEINIDTLNKVLEVNIKNNIKDDRRYFIVFYIWYNGKNKVNWYCWFNYTKYLDAKDAIKDIIEVNWLDKASIASFKEVSKEEYRIFLDLDEVNWKLFNK